MTPKNLLFILIIAVYALVVSAYLVWIPKYQELVNLKEELKIKTEALDQKQRYFSKLTNLSVKLEKYQKEIDKIVLALPEENDEPAVYNFLQKTTGESGLILDNIASSAGAQAASSGTELQNKKMSFSLDLSGSYLSFKNYLSDIYNNSRLFEVESITFSTPKENGLFSFKISIAVYYLQKTNSAQVLPVVSP